MPNQVMGLDEYMMRPIEGLANPHRLEPPNLDIPLLAVLVRYIGIGQQRAAGAVHQSLKRLVAVGQPMAGEIWSRTISTTCFRSAAPSAFRCCRSPEAKPAAE